jgi:hypothetical protein
LSMRAMAAKRSRSYPTIVGAPEMKRCVETGDGVRCRVLVGLNCLNFSPRFRQ